MDELPDFTDAELGQLTEAFFRGELSDDEAQKLAGFLIIREQEKLLSDMKSFVSEQQLINTAASYALIAIGVFFIALIIVVFTYYG